MVEFIRSDLNKMKSWVLEKGKSGPTEHHQQMLGVYTEQNNQLLFSPLAFGRASQKQRMPSKIQRTDSVFSSLPIARNTV